jgi:hypothetical protein
MHEAFHTQEDMKTACQVLAQNSGGWKLLRRPAFGMENIRVDHKQTV